MTKYNQEFFHELKKIVDGEVRFDAGTIALYSTDGSNYRLPPIGVVIPRNVEDINKAVRLARAYDVPVLGRGCGTSLAGQCCNTALVIDTSKYLNRVLEIDTERKLARVEPGTILDDLREAAAQYGLTYGPDPATHNHCTIGGMIGNNSCGIHSVLAEFYGPGPRTADNVHELDVLTYDGLRMRVGGTSAEQFESIVRSGGRRGDIYARLKSLGERYEREINHRFPSIPRRVSGYNLPQVLPERQFNLARALVGTESTCAITLEATVKLIDTPRARVLVVLGYPSVYAAGDHVPEIREHKPIGLEGIDHRLIDYMKRKQLHPSDAALLPEGGGWLFVEFGGNTGDEAADRAHHLMDRLNRADNPPKLVFHDDRQSMEKLWEIRESGLGATAFVPGERDSWPGWEDSAVPPDKVGDYLRDLRKLFKKHGYDCSLYGHFGQGCIHTRIDFDLTTADGIENYRSFTEEAAEMVVDRYGGSLSGEHGDGQARGEMLRIMYGKEILDGFREFKRIWDPHWKMNPGKVIDAYPRDANLRLGSDYRPWIPKTHFRYTEDGGSFAHAALRCVGVGKCRRLDGGIMCPSFMVTREEKDTTRGRAHALFEMMQGEVITDRWRSDEVKDALHLCLACKGCKGDCPVNVDMATYKAEFLSHYYEARLRPRSAYAFGLIYWWSRLASLMPEVVNFFTQTPLLSSAAKLIAGMAPERQIPRFAPQTFKGKFRERPKSDGRPNVLLWPDTFNNHFYPEVAEAAVEVLEAAGYHVQIPEVSLCCGRPLYDYGMLTTAKSLLRQAMRGLRPHLSAGTPIVVLEPSCASVFRDELMNLFPNDQDAKRLNEKTFLLSEFLEQEAEKFAPPKLHRKALLHSHCHHKALMGMEHEHSLLKKLGLELTVPNSGCCGMAGSFGFEEGERYDVSIRAGERVLLPAVRQAGKDDLIVADGFSCREQIRQRTRREALHSAQVLQLALQQPSPTHVTNPPEQASVSRREREHAKARVTTAAVVAGVVATAMIFRRNRKMSGG